MPPPSPIFGGQTVPGDSPLNVVSLLQDIADARCRMYARVYELSRKGAADADDVDVALIAWRQAQIDLTRERERRATS